VHHAEQGSLGDIRAGAAGSQADDVRTRRAAPARRSQAEQRGDAPRPGSEITRWIAWVSTNGRSTASDTI